MGDFNIDLLKYNINDNANNFINQMYASSFYPLITKPTRITKTSATLIDNIFVNRFCDKTLSGLLFTDLSDHLPVFQITVVQCQTRSQTRETSKIRAINDNNISRLCEDLERTDFSEIHTCTDPETAYILFHPKLMKVYDKHLPLVNVKNHYVSPKKPWITKDTHVKEN